MSKPNKPNNKPNSQANKPQTPAAAAAEVPVDPQTRLDALIKDLEEKNRQLENEKEARNYFQLERDRVNSFWDITKKELANARSLLKNKDRDIEEAEEKHQVELKVYKQKVRHLLYEQKITVDRLKIESENALKQQAEEAKQIQDALKTEKHNLRKGIEQDQHNHEDAIKTLRLQQDKYVSQLKDEFDTQIKTLTGLYESKMNELRDDLFLRAKKEVSEVEERKNAHIKELMKKHDYAFAEIKNYYNMITTNNLVLIKTLKDQVETMKKNESNNEKLMFEIATENKKLSEPLTIALAEIEQLKKELVNYEKDKLSLKNTKSRLNMVEDHLKTLKWEHDILDTNFVKVQKERDEIYYKFEKTIQDVQQKTLMKNQLLDAKVQQLQENIDKKEATLKELMKVNNIGEEFVHQVSAPLEDMLDDRNRAIHDMEFNVEKTKKQYVDFVNYALAKMHQYGIPHDEIDALHPETLPEPATLAPVL